MSKSLENTQTQQNLIDAFAGESQARNRYDYFASVAKKEGYEQIAEIFSITAENEKEHAKLFYKHLGEGAFKPSLEYPCFLGNTLENLEFAAKGEHEEWNVQYANAAEIALEEGFAEIADTFKQVLEAEKHHELRYRALAENVRNNYVFSKGSEVQWICRNCGRVVFSSDAPDICPTCKHPQAYFELLCNNF